MPSTRAGLLDHIEALGGAKAEAGGGGALAAAHWMQQPRRPAGTGVAVEMEHLETALAARATAMGVEIRRGRGVDALNRSDDDVAVRAGGETFRGRWLVGCDGGRSTVRTRAGSAFVGTDPEFTGHSVDADPADPDALRPGRHPTPAGMSTDARPRTTAMVEFDEGAFHRVQPITLDHVQAVQMA